MWRSIIDKLPVVGHSNARGSMHSLRFVWFRRFDLFSSWVSWWIMDGISSRCGRPAAPPRLWTLGVTDGSWTGDALHAGFAFMRDRRRQEQSLVCWVWELFQNQCWYIRWLIGLYFFPNSFCLPYNNFRKRTFTGLNHYWLNFKVNKSYGLQLSPLRAFSRTPENRSRTGPGWSPSTPKFTLTYC